MCFQQLSVTAPYVYSTLSIYNYIQAYVIAIKAIVLMDINKS